MALHDRLRDDSRAMFDTLADLRHRLHQHPEVGLDLPVTQRIVLEALAHLDLEITTGESLSSVTAVLRGGQPGPAVLLRGDMDGLPEEGWDGAGRMLEEGVLDAAGQRVSSAYGMHVFSAQIPRHQFTTRPGSLMAASDGLHVTVRGEGTHGSTPYLGKDPVTAATEMVTALQTLVTRRFDIFDPVVVTVGSFHAGTRRNIIPDEAKFEATVRSFSAAARERIEKEATALCRQIAAAHGLEADVDYFHEYPLTVNDAEHTAFAAGVVADVFGEDRFATEANPHPGAEDFSRVLEAVPGCYLFLGAHPGDSAEHPNNHSPRAVFVDDVLPDGVLLHSELAIRALQRDTEQAATREPVTTQGE
jgi:metal-dependent amidase/aminoacylase/carboxypeptidase family protein